MGRGHAPGDVVEGRGGGGGGPKTLRTQNQPKSIPGGGGAVFRGGKSESTNSGATKSVPVLKNERTRYVWLPIIAHEKQRALAAITCTNPERHQTNCGKIFVQSLNCRNSSLCTPPPPWTQISWWEKKLIYKRKQRNLLLRLSAIPMHPWAWDPFLGSLCGAVGGGGGGGASAASRGACSTAVAGHVHGGKSYGLGSWTELAASVRQGQRVLPVISPAPCTTQ